MTDGALLDQGWRIQFLLSGILVFVRLWIRLAVSGSKVFERASQEAAATQGTERAPVLEVLRHHWRKTLVAVVYQGYRPGRRSQGRGPGRAALLTAPPRPRS
ncbi:hypothetical protein [Nocardiopsis valliformis]|uniref:hypothetical protein n=1 Tax=Nocardiopsis valliformis TaxID=239974 RepID=UPI0019552B01|nr:hypothetical protein [Nocardiopsis valliformis]